MKQEEPGVEAWVCPQMIHFPAQSCTAMSSLEIYEYRGMSNIAVGVDMLACALSLDFLRKATKPSTRVAMARPLAGVAKAKVARAHGEQVDLAGGLSAAQAMRGRQP